MRPVREQGPDPKTESEDFARHKREQIRLGLRLTPAERLRWLEETMEEMRELQRLARRRPDRS